MNHHPSVPASNSRIINGTALGFSILFLLASLAAACFVGRGRSRKTEKVCFFIQEELCKKFVKKKKFKIKCRLRCVLLYGFREKAVL